MNRAAIFAALLTAGVGGALAQSAKPDREDVPPPPQTQGQLNSMAAKDPSKPEEMRPLSSAAQQDPQKKPEQTPEKKKVREAADSRPKPRASEQKPKSR
jgi:hypothetical protein